MNADGSAIGAVFSPSGRSLLFSRDTQQPDSGEFFVWREGGDESWPSECPARPRVESPGRYRQEFQVLRNASMPQQPRLATVYANPQAASVTQPEQRPYPYGSVLLMEWRNDPEPGEVVRVDVMRRERGYGEAYGQDRAGEWEFASFRPDGAPLDPPADPVACARCHAKAGPARDFVFRGRFPPGT